MTESPATDGFVDKWRAREPELALVEVFCPAPRRPLFRAVGALLSELVESTFEISDSSVARTKLLWWLQDLESGERGRHPLTRAIHATSDRGHPSPEHWQRLLQAALELLESDHRPAKLADAIDELLPFAQAWAAIESSLLGSAGDSRQIAFCLQMQRSLRALGGIFPDRSRLPAPWTASPDAERIRRYAEDLLALAPDDVSPSLVGVARMLAARQRLHQLSATADARSAFQVSPWNALWLGWRAARVARRCESRDLS